MSHVLYFTADWCGPCKKVRPVVEELNRDQSYAKFQVIDVDSEQELARKFEVKSIPTFIFIRDGIEINRLTGAQTREKLLEMLKDEKISEENV
jgi:thioredoxin 1